MEDTMTTSQAAKLLGVSDSTVRGYVRRKVLPVARRVNARLLLVARADVERLKANPPRSGPVPRPKRPSSRPESTDPD